MQDVVGMIFHDVVLLDTRSLGATFGPRFDVNVRHRSLPRDWRREEV
jgi:hypothetical protein